MNGKRESKQEYLGAVDGDGATRLAQPTCRGCAEERPTYPWVDKDYRDLSNVDTKLGCGVEGRAAS